MNVLTVLALAVAASAAPPAAAAQQDATDLPPAGYGTLKQEDIALKFETPTLLIRILPLDERVLRLLAPDSYESLRGLKALKAAAVDSVARRLGGGDPSLFAVTFFARQGQSEFDPDDVSITSRNRFFRPLAILPLTPGWSEQRLEQRRTATAVYLFEPGIFVLEPMQVSYAGFISREWDERRLQALDQERSAVIARAARAGGGTPR